MARLKVSIFLIFATLLVLNCSNRPGLVDPFGTKTFWSSQFRNGVVSPKKIPSVFIGSSEGAMVYSELDNLIDTDVAADLLSTFEAQMKDKEHALFGLPLDINEDKKVSILILDIDDGAAVDTPSITGYFDPFNQFNDAKVYEATCENSSTNDCARSNEMEVLYLDVALARKADKKSLNATLAHEYQHVLHFARDYNANPDNVQVESTWVNEGLSEVASDITGFGPQSNRLSSFADVRGNSLTSWNTASPLVDYAHSYAYFRFLADVYGETIISQVFTSNKFSVEGVNEALGQQNDADLLGNCGSQTAASNTLFDCSYRYFWAAVLGISSPQGNRGTGTLQNPLFTRAAKYSFAAGHAPTTPTKVTTKNVVLPAYASELHSKTAGATATLNDTTPACPTCSKSSFTILFETSTGTPSEQYLVYNHEVNSADNTLINVDPQIANQSHNGESCGHIAPTREVLIRLSN